MSTIALSDALARYELQHIAGLAETTQGKTMSQLRQFETWIVREMRQDPYLSSIDDLTMSRYCNTLRPPRLAESTFNLYRSRLSTFWVYCTRRGWIAENPMEYVRPMRVPDAVRTRLAVEEMDTILDKAENERDRIALSIGMNLALRAGDIAALDISSVNLYDNTVHAYIKKTKKWEMLQVNDELRADLLRWYDAYAVLAGVTDSSHLDNSWTLVPSLRNLPLPGGKRRLIALPTSRYKNLHEVVQRGLLSIDMPIRRDDGKSLREGFHTLRRSSGRAFFENAEVDPEIEGSAIRAAMAFLGHSTQNVTEIYLGVEHDKLARDKAMRGKSFLRKIAERNEQRDTDAEAEPLKVVRHA